jgi:hypothetical protein
VKALQDSLSILAFPNQVTLNKTFEAKLALVTRGFSDITTKISGGR